MHTDPLRYRLFQERPALAITLAGLTVPAWNRRMPRPCCAGRNVSSPPTVPRRSSGIGTETPGTIPVLCTPGTSIVVGFGVQLLMYATPVIYPLSILPEPYRTWMLLNPMAPLMELFRHAYLGAGEVSLGLLLYATILIGLILFVGVLLFNRVERTFMDTV